MSNFKLTIGLCIYIVLACGVVPAVSVILNAPLLFFIAAPLLTCLFVAWWWIPISAKKRQGNKP